jgi:hypothetical protein
MKTGKNMNQKEISKQIEFIWRITSAHTISYFIAGIFALIFMNYKQQFGGEIISEIMRPFDSPWVALGSGLQIIRGLILSLILLPFREILISRKGWVKLSGLLLGLSYFLTIGPTFGSFEGYIYTKISLQYHLLGIPETLIYIYLFTLSLSLWYRKEKKVFNRISIIIVILIILMSLLGLLSSLGIIEQ